MHAPPPPDAGASELDRVVDNLTSLMQIGRACGVSLDFSDHRRRAAERRRLAEDGGDRATRAQALRELIELADRVATYAESALNPLADHGLGDLRDDLERWIHIARERTSAARRTAEVEPA